MSSAAVVIGALRVNMQPERILTASLIVFFQGTVILDLIAEMPFEPLLHYAEICSSKDTEKEHVL